MTPEFDLRQIRRRIRRHRRPLAAASAFTAVLTFGLALQPEAPASVSDGPKVPAGFVEMPVLLMDAAIASALAPGDTIDVIAQGPTPKVVAANAIVIEAASGGGFTSGGGSAVVLALSREAALTVAGTDAPLTVIRNPDDF